jgi:signal transduction histidine kinase
MELINMSFLDNRTIKQKLISITMLTCLSALLLVGSGYMIWGWANIHNDMVQRLSTHAELIADNCKAALAFDDSQDATDTLQALHVEPSIVFGCIYDNNHEVFALYNPDNANVIKSTEFRVNGHQFSDGYLTVFRSIILDNEVIGNVYLISDLQPMYAVLKTNILIIIGVLILASLAAYIVSSRLQRFISEPIMELADTAKVVTEKKDYGIRVISHTKDEVGMFINTFNEMLEQIQKRDSALVSARDDLEERVKLRTADLTAANEQLTREVSEREKAEAQQTKLLKTIEKTNEELKDFAYIVSHDLKAPLRGISTLADWIVNDYADKLDEEGKEQMNLLLSRVERMHNLIEGVLQYSRVGRVEEQHVIINLNELVPEVIDMVSPPENIKITIESELPAVKCEQTRIMQVFQNLLSNAIKYMDKPEGYIKIFCREDTDSFVFSVSDNGPGIEEKYFKKIFQLFQTLSARDEYESTGVGLTVTKKIVELFGGRIWVESEPGKGSTFFFTLSKVETGVRNEDYETNIIS